MKTQPTNPKRLFLSKITLLAACLALSMGVQATPIIWSGPTTNYMEPAAGAADVLVPGKVSLARNSRQWLYNTNTESACFEIIDPNTLVVTNSSPTDTEWAFGTLNHATDGTLTYQPFAAYRNGFLQAVLLSGPMVCHLIKEDIYLQVTFTAWTSSDFIGTGFFAYTRTTPAAVTPPTPTVSITNPAPNAVFAAPANVAIFASASVSSGTITNVSFFNGGSLLGSSQASPFHITANSLGAGPYSLKAVATAAGVSGTSSVVNISVVTPVNTLLSAPVAGNNQFVFSYNVNPGLSYVVQRSPDLSNWISLVTNAPTGSPAFFTNPISGSPNFFRVGRMPNP